MSKPRLSPNEAARSEDSQASRPWLTVTTPLLPSYAELAPLIQDMLNRKWLTNQGRYATALEAALRARLGVEHLRLITNGTIALEIGVDALWPEGGEIITTPFSFPATWNSLLRHPNITPVFVDIDDDYGIDVAAMEAAISPRTQGVLGVHVYGFPCAVEAIEQVAHRHDLRVMYDAAHVFGTVRDGRPIGTWGDVCAWSFHATKVFNTLEGGALTTNHAEIDHQIGLRRNFGIVGEDSLELVGTNGKMDELRAIFGLTLIEKVDAAISARLGVAEQYRAALPEIGCDAVTVPAAWDRPGQRLNAAYFPIRVSPSCGRDRESLSAILREDGIFARRYFHPTITSSPLHASRYVPGSLPRAEAASREMICLPIHHEMTEADVSRVINSIRRWVIGD
jgi:dTDP-4-amino-4,6-dideoxygalactose transaminase